MSLRKRGAVSWIDFYTPSGERVRRSADTANKAHDQAAALFKELPPHCKRPAELSITHKSSSHLEADLDIGEARHTAPDNRVAWRRITRAIEVTTEAGEL